MQQSWGLHEWGLALQSDEKVWLSWKAPKTHSIDDPGCHSMWFWLPDTTLLKTVHLNFPLPQSELLSCHPAQRQHCQIAQCRLVNWHFDNAVGVFFFNSVCMKSIVLQRNAIWLNRQYSKCLWKLTEQKKKSYSWCFLTSPWNYLAKIIFPVKFH